MESSVKNSLLYEVAPPVASSGNKVTVVGVGQVGMACAFSILTQGDHGIQHQVYLSLPCVLTSNGVSHVVKQILTKDEESKLQASADLMNKVQEDLKY